MNIKSLEAGLELKNYPTLCKALGVEPKSGKSKILQLEDLERFVKYEKMGHRFVIKEVYDIPFPKIDNRGKQGKYIDLVQLLVTDYLVEQKRQVVTMTLNKALEKIKLINENFSYCSNNVPTFSSYLGIEEQISYDHFMLTRNNFKRVFERSLDNLADMSLISFHKDAVFITDMENEQHLANDDEVELFNECGEIALNNLLGDKKRSQRTMSSVRYSKYWNKYKKESNKLFKEKMAEDKYGNVEVKKVYIGYRIIINRNAIKEAHNELLIEYLDDTQRKNKFDELETLVLSDLAEKVIKRQTEARDINNKNVNERMREYRSMFSYVADNKKIINLVHKQGAADVAKAIENKRKRKHTKEDENAIDIVLSKDN